MRLPVGSDHRHELVAVSALNQYLYCPRRYWYYRFYDAGDRSADFVEGTARHRDQRRQRDQFREQYYVAPSLDLHGQVDLVEETEQGLVPVERKRATSGRYYWNDEVQLAGYCCLLNAAAERQVDRGYIYLYETDKRHEILITEKHQQAVMDAISAIRSMSPDEPPGVVDNPNKCRGCSVRHECLPAATSRLDPEVAAGSEWAEVSPHE